MDEEDRRFLARFVEDFPAALDEDGALPLNPLSHTVSLEELHGESLEMGMRLLANSSAPPVLAALLCQAAVSQLLHSDLSPFCSTQEAAADQEEEETGVLFQTVPVQRFFLNKLFSLALEWHHKSFKPPSPPPQLRLCSTHAIRNARRKMEDKHLALAEFNQLFNFQDGVDRAYYAVFDGHGGVDAATYASLHLHVALSKQETLRSDAAAAFKQAFKHTDDMFRGKAQRERLRSGTTGVAVLIQDQELTVSWLGDSQVMLVRKGQDVSLMEPHKPDREDEKQRIEDLGGCVTFMGCWRVNGTYAVSRAIGDFDQKPYVSADADCSTVQLSGDEDYVLLACDGFFDTVKPSEVPHLVAEALRRPDDPEGGAGDAPAGVKGQGVAQHLVRAARDAGSGDNITVMVVFLRPPEQLLPPDTSTGTAAAAQEDHTSHDAPLQ